jgi:hypothetical protein
MPYDYWGALYSSRADFELQSPKYLDLAARAQAVACAYHAGTLKRNYPSE